MEDPKDPKVLKDPMEVLKISGGRGDFPLFEKILEFSGNNYPERSIFLTGVTGPHGEASAASGNYDDLPYLAQIGDLKSLIYLEKKQNLLPGKRCLRSAVKYDQIGIIRWFYKKGWTLSSEELRIAARKGYLDIIKFASGSGKTKIDQSAMIEALSNGQIAIVKFLSEQTGAFFGWDLGYLFELGIPSKISIKFLQWLESRGITFPGKFSGDFLDFLTRIAQRDGNLKLLKWFWKRGIIPSSANNSKNLKTLKWLILRRVPVTEFGADHFATKGDIKTLEWLANQFNIYPEDLSRAAYQGHLKVLLWLESKHKFPVGDIELLCWCAAQGGHISILEFLLKKGYKHHFRWYYESADWMEAHGIYPDDLGIMGAIISVFEFPKRVMPRKCSKPPSEYLKLIKKRSVGNHLTKYALEKGRFKLLEDCLKLSFRPDFKELFDYDYSQFAADLSDENMKKCLEILMNHKISISQELIDWLIRNEFLGTLIWLGEKKGIYPSSAEMALWQGHLNILQWLATNHIYPSTLERALGRTLELIKNTRIYSWFETHETLAKTFAVGAAGGMLGIGLVYLFGE